MSSSFTGTNSLQLLFSTETQLTAGQIDQAGPSLAPSIGKVVPAMSPDDEPETTENPFYDIEFEYPQSSTKLRSLKIISWLWNLQLKISKIL